MIISELSGGWKEGVRRTLSRRAAGLLLEELAGLRRAARMWTRQRVVKADYISTMIVSL